jgi:general stress protein 26
MASDDQREQLSGNEAVQRVQGLLEHFRSAMMMTTSASGELHVRPMALRGKASDFDGVMWFLADDRSRAVEEIGAGAPLQLVFQSDDDSAYLHLAGTGKVLWDRGKIEELFSPLFKTWFPEGPTDPHVALIRFDVDRGSFWESPGGFLRVLAAFTKSVVTGREGKGAEIGDVTL